MAGIIALIGRIIAVLPLVVSSSIAMVQVCIKAVKEIVTAIMNILFPFFPDGGKFETAVLKVRNKINAFEAWFDNIKNVILKLTGVKTV